MNKEWSQVAAAAFCFVVLIASTGSAVTLSGPATAPPGGVTWTPLASTCDPNCGAYTYGTSPVTASGFNFAKFRTAYWQPTLNASTTLAYDSANSNLAGGVAVWSSTAPVAFGFWNATTQTCNTSNYDVRATWTVTDTSSHALALTDPTTLGFAATRGPFLQITGSFNSLMNFQGRLSGTTNAWGAINITVDGCTSTSLAVTAGFSVGNFYYDAVPHIGTIAPSSGAAHGGQSVTITDTCCLGGASAVTFGGAAATIGVNTDTSLTVTTPAHASGPVDVAITTANGTSDTPAAYTYIDLPFVTKTFGASTIPLNGTTSLNFNIANSSTTTTMAGVGFTDALPSGLVIATPNNVSNTCGGTLTAG